MSYNAKNTNKQRGRLFYLMGKSAAGKDRIYSHLIRDQGLHLQRLVLYTTRPMRTKEENGREYFFVDEEKYQKFVAAGRIIEERTYHTQSGDWRYFTADDGQMDLQSNSYLGIGTLESFRQLQEYLGEDTVRPLYIEVETGERISRALAREKNQEIPNYQELCRRFLADEEDFSEERLLQAGIGHRFVNENLDKCIQEIKDYIREEDR